MRLVMLVPMLAPMTANTAVPALNSPAATSVMISEVVKEELCTTEVTNTEAINATSGLSP